MLVICACLFAGLSVPLFVFSPLPPLGLTLAVALALTAGLCLYALLIPKHVVRAQRWIEDILGKEHSDHLGRWVP
jgi:hypothetical protein